MRVALWAAVAVALVVTFWNLRRRRLLTRQVEDLRWDLRSLRRQVEALPEKIEEALAPTRVQLARLAAGEALPPSMIESGLGFVEVSASEAHAWHEQDAKGVFLLDVRSPHEREEERIPGAHWIPLDELERRYAREIPRQGVKVVVHCAHGERSRAACAFLSRRGYTNLYNLQEGIVGWPGARTSGAPPALVQIEGLGARPRP